MPEPRFDPSKEITFDLTHGVVQLGGAPLRVLVPADALAMLCVAAGTEASTTFGRALGDVMGKRVASRLGSPSRGADPREAVRRATLEMVVEHLGGELALAGLGSLGLERWGRALVMVIDQSPLGPGGDTVLEATLGAAVGAATGRLVRARRLSRDGVRVRFFMGSERAAFKVRAWLVQGVTWGEALARLHGPESNPRGAVHDRPPEPGGGA